VVTITDAKVRRHAEGHHGESRNDRRALEQHHDVQADAGALAEVSPIATCLSKFADDVA